MRIPVEDVVHGMQLKGIPVKEVRVCKQMAGLGLGTGWPEELVAKDRAGITVGPKNIYSR